jgi:trans-2,3-dihydro-3-hydroxyanthranilate isomerase
MQAIARETNLSETVFGLTPRRAECPARVRIFTPTRELPFAGHPTLGSAFVLVDEGIVRPSDSRFLLEENIGPVPVSMDPDGLFWLTTPPIHDGRAFDPAACARALGLEPKELLGPTPRLLSAGNPTVFVAVRSEAAVDAAALDASAMRVLRDADAERFCVYVFTPRPDGAYARMFAPEYGIVEDPATGSSAGPLALFMMREGLASRTTGTRLRCEQGTRMGRRSILHVLVRGDGGAEGLDVGGRVVPLAEGTMTF